MQGTLGSDGTSFVDPYCYFDLEADLIACLSQGFDIDWMEAFTYARAARSGLGTAGFECRAGRGDRDRCQRLTTGDSPVPT